MSKIWIVFVIFLITDSTFWYFLHDLPLCSVILLTGLLSIAWYFELPSSIWLHQDLVEHKKKDAGTIALKDKITISKLNTIANLEDIKPVNTFFSSKQRIHDTEEFLEDTQEAIVKALLIYGFVTICFLVAYAQSNKLEGDALEAFKAYKFYAAYIYLGITFCYLSWHISPALIIKKKNKMLSKE